MRDLSLHILDLIENSIRAEASVICVTVARDPARDLMAISVEDNGFGLDVPAEVATDPFYTTKPKGKTGLGLSFLRASAEQAGGGLSISRSRLGGTLVRATMQLSHIDRRPLGDLAATLSSVVCTNPDVDLRCRLRAGGRESALCAAELARQLPAAERGGLAVARLVHEKVRGTLTALGFDE